MWQRFHRLDTKKELAKIAVRAKENQGTRTDLTSVRNLTEVDTKKELAKIAVRAKENQGTRTDLGNNLPQKSAESQSDRETRTQIVQEALERRESWGPVRQVPPDQRPLPIPPPIRGRSKRTRGDSIPITDEMKALMRKFLENEDRPVRSLIRRDYDVDTSDIHRWLSGEKQFMRAGTWNKLKPVLERFSGE